VDIVVKGCVVKGLRLMTSKWGGFDILAGEKFGAGVQIAFLHADHLSPEQKQTIYPNGKVYNLTIQWPLKQEKVLTSATIAPVPDFLKSEEPKKEQPKPKQTPFKPNKYQDAILSATVNGGNLFSPNAPHVLIEALAGTGKTSTLVWLVNELAARKLVQGKRIIYLAFNRSIAEELNERLAGTGVPAQTTHAFGFGLIKQRFGKEIKPYNGRCAGDAFMKIVCDDNGLRYNAESFKLARKSPEYELRPAVLELVGYIKSWAIFPKFDGVWGFAKDQEETIGELVGMYEIEYPTATFTERDLVQYAMRVVIANLPDATGHLTEIDYDDMLYLPLCMNLPVPRYDLVLTDESQDFNACQILLLEKLIRAEGTQS
jgi:superfamily I DNA/RNA helicase